MAISENQTYQLERKGIVLKPDYSKRVEAGGVLNPAVASHNGKAYLLYRSVDSTPHNYSRIMLAELVQQGDTVISERLDLCALEPQESYEKWRDPVQGGGVEDPRVTPMEDGTYLMAYACYGYGPGGDQIPRIAFARSSDLLKWDRLGLINYSPLEIGVGSSRIKLDIQTVSNKDAALFPEKIGGRYVMMHRPTLPKNIGLEPGEVSAIWLSYSEDLINWTEHTLIMKSKESWENFKIGGGTPPLKTPGGWLCFYHGVEGKSDLDPDRRYSAGAMLLDLNDPRKVIYRSPSPVLSPGTDQEKEGVVNNVVFPTGTLTAPDGRIQVFYGMADTAIGMAATSRPVL